MSHLQNRPICNRGLSLFSIFAVILGASHLSQAEHPNSIASAGQPADIASSAYQFRADRKAEQNAPESWFALMRYAGQPLNKPADLNDPAIKQALCGLLWEEIRPVKTLQLTWAADAKRRPAPEELAITTLNNQGSASSWWNNTIAEKQTIKPTVSADGTTYAYDMGMDTCGIVFSIVGDKPASEYDVPTVRALTADTWKKMDIEIEWAYEPATAEKDYSGRIETYDGVAAGLLPLDGDGTTAAIDSNSWRSQGKSSAHRGVKLNLLYLGASKWRRVQPYTTQPDDVARTIVTLWTKAGNFSFLAADLENGPILAPEYGFFVRRTSEPASPPAVLSESPIGLSSRAASAAEYIEELKARKMSTIRRQTRIHEEQTWEGAVTAMRGTNLPPHPQPPAGSEPSMQVQVPSERLTAQWNLGAWHLVRHCEKNPKNGRLWFNDYPYGILAAETYLVLAVLDMIGSHQAAEDGLDQWTSLPMDPNSAGHHEWALPDRPNGLFSEGHGCLTHAVGPAGIGGQMDGIHAFGPGSIGYALVEHYWLTGDAQWLKTNAPRIKANAEWMLRQRQVGASMVPGGERLWCKGLLPARQPTPDSGGLWMHVYECEAYYWLFVSQFSDALSTIDPPAGAKLKADAEAYRKDILAAVERSIALSPVVPVRDGTFHSVIPFACYVRGLSTGAWGWKRDGSGEHVGPLYWETVQTAAPLISPAGLLSPNDVRVQGYLDVLEDRLLLENANVGNRNWFDAGWQYQGGLERTANMHLVGDDVPVFLRSFLNCYAVDILPNDGYIFNEHAVHGPPDKIFEEAAFLERFRNLLVMEDADSLWLARATPRAWLEQGKKITVKNAPTHFGEVAYEIVSDADEGKIAATVEMPSRNPPKSVLLRFRHPKALPIKSVSVNGSSWTDFDPGKEVISLHDFKGRLRWRADTEDGAYPAAHGEFTRRFLEISLHETGRRNMNSRERVVTALNHEEPDRLPIDLGGTVVTSIANSTYAALRDHLKLPKVPIRTLEPAQQVAVVDDDVLELLGVDVIPVFANAPSSGPLQIVDEPDGSQFVQGRLRRDLAAFQERLLLRLAGVSLERAVDRGHAEDALAGPGRSGSLSGTPRASAATSQDHRLRAVRHGPLRTRPVQPTPPRPRHGERADGSRGRARVCRWHSWNG